MADLQLSWTDPSTGFTYPAAVLKIVDALVHKAALHAELAIAIYTDATAAQPASQRGPVFQDNQLLLTPAEIAQLAISFELQLYAILQQRPQYAGGVVVP